MTTRREVLQATSLTLGAMALGRRAMAADFPSRNFDVVIPTREGGGADRLLRAFAGVWKSYLDVELEIGFFPGASGAVGYQVFMGKRDPNPHNLLFGNMGPELAVMVVQAPGYSYPEDFQYFARLDVDPSVMFVNADSPFQTVDDVIEAAKERPLNVSTSRLPHPASIGALLLGEHTGAQFNLVPLSGGRNTIAGVVTGEVDLGVLPAGSVGAAGDALRTLLIWDDTNPNPEVFSNAPTMNEHFGTSAPALVSSRAFAIHTATIEQFPDEVALLESTARQAAEDPAWIEAAKEANQPVELLNFGDRAACDTFAVGMIEQATKYKGLLTGQG
jgi:tripartite-type tricarboxylate transporter receptor subunit TctC